MSTSFPRDAALQQIISTMRAEHITPKDVAKAFDAGAATEHATSGITKAFAWLGGILIFAGIATYIGMFWEDMNSAMRILITLGSGLCLYIWAVVSLNDARFARAVTPAFGVAIVLETAGWFVLIDELFPPSDEWRYAVLFVTFIMGVQQLAVFSKFRSTLLLFFVFVFGYAMAFTALDLLEIREQQIMLVLGLSMMALAHAITKTAHLRLSGIGYFVGSIFMYMGFFDLVRDSVGEILFPALAVANLVYVSTQVRSTALLATSTGALLCYIGYFTSEHFLDTVGWPLTLVIMGIACMAISSSALKIKRKM